MLGVLAAGCRGPLDADYSGLDLAEVSGTVTLDSVPLSDVTVIFESEDGTYSSGLTDGTGRYRLMFNSERSGVTPGKKVVRIVAGAVGEDSAEEAGDPDEGGPRSVQSVPERYNRNSDLTATVEPGGRHTFDFALESGIEAPAN
jgi:hypothetical protein